MTATILEETPFPRFRPGETLHPGLEPLLERLGAAAVVAKGGYLRHAGTFVEWGARCGFVPFGEDAGGPWLGFQAPRGDFDQRLIGVARESGAEILAERAIGISLGANQVETATGPLKARCVVDASGTRHWLARQLGVPIRRASPRLVARYGYAEGSAPPDVMLPCMRATEHGWLWSADLGKGTYQWTNVTEPTHRPPKTWAPPGWEGMRLEESHGADVTWRIAAQTAGEGWFLCGDAGCVLDPSSAHGVLRAVMSGMMAGHLAAAVWSGKMGASDAAAGYREWFAEWFRHDAEHLSQAYREAGLFGF